VRRPVSLTSRALTHASAGEVLEYAVLLTVKEKNPEAFERSFAQLKTFYNECVAVGTVCSALTPSRAVIVKCTLATVRACCWA